MRFEKGMEVCTADGEKIGTISRVVIDAKTRDVTDLVVQRGTLSKTEKVIPTGLVDFENDGRIQLRQTNQGVEDFLDYETTHYVPIEQLDAPYTNVPGAYWYPPTGVSAPPGDTGLMSETGVDRVPRTETSIPEGRIAIMEGAHVISVDEKHIGNVEQVITDPEGSQLTHIVVGKGFLLKEHKLVPIHWVREISDDRLFLSVKASLFEQLPDYQPH